MQCRQRIVLCFYVTTQLDVFCIAILDITIHPSHVPCSPSPTYGLHYCTMPCGLDPVRRCLLPSRLPDTITGMPMPPSPPATHPHLPAHPATTPTYPAARLCTPPHTHTRTPHPHHAFPTLPTPHTPSPTTDILATPLTQHPCRAAFRFPALQRFPNPLPFPLPLPPVHRAGDKPCSCDIPVRVSGPPTTRHRRFGFPTPPPPPPRTC